LLNFLSTTVELKVVDLTETQTLARPVHPSALTPAGIVKHLTGVERASHRLPEIRLPATSRAGRRTAVLVGGRSSDG
jgi:hypothetical protein